jgi:hypothetical protein
VRSRHGRPKRRHFLALTSINVISLRPVMLSPVASWS